MHNSQKEFQSFHATNIVMHIHFYDENVISNKNHVHLHCDYAFYF